MNDLALKMLLGDRAKYIMLISGLTFAALLMTEQAAIFCGIMQWSGSTLDNVGAPIWVVDPMVEQINDTEALRDTDLNRVRSVEGVAWAAPFYQGILRTRMTDGSFKFVQLIGLDATTFASAPTEITQGKLDDLRLPNTVILDEYGAKKLSRNPARPIRAGDTFEINDHEARVVGICKARMAFSGNPHVFTTYDQAVQYAPGTRKMLSCVLAGAQAGKQPAEIARRITAATGLKACTKSEFLWMTVWLKEVNFEAFLGELLMLVGLSGCGKTTLLSVIAGTLGVDRGEVEVFNSPLHSLDKGAVTQFRAANIGFIFQQYNLIPTLNCLENVSVPLRIQGQKAARAEKKAAEVLETVGLGTRMHHRPSMLSGGQQQRVAIARALVHDPKLIICDEPTAALDSENGTKVMELLRDVAAKPDRCVIIVTHDNRVFKYADRMTFMEDGRINRTETNQPSAAQRN